MAKTQWLNFYKDMTANGHLDWYKYDISEDIKIEPATGIIEKHKVEAAIEGLFQNHTRKIVIFFNYSLQYDISLFGSLNDRSLDIDLTVWDDGKLRMSELRNYKSADFYTPTRAPWPDWVKQLRNLLQSMYLYRDSQAVHISSKNKAKFEIVNRAIQSLP